MPSRPPLYFMFVLCRVPLLDMIHIRHTECFSQFQRTSINHQCTTHNQPRAWKSVTLRPKYTAGIWENRHVKKSRRRHSTQQCVLNSRYSSKPFNSSTPTSRRCRRAKLQFQDIPFLLLLPAYYFFVARSPTEQNDAQFLIFWEPPSVYIALTLYYFFRHERFSAGTVAVGPVFLARFRAFTQVTVSVAVATHSILFFFVTHSGNERDCI